MEEITCVSFLLVLFPAPWEFTRMAKGSLLPWLIAHKFGEYHEPLKSLGLINRSYCLSRLILLSLSSGFHVRYGDIHFG